MELLGETSGPDAPPAGPRHLTIEAENYHSLLLLGHLYAGQVDCIYIDPPYNTGATDWQYNNAFVDDSDSYRHSKWLAMIARRVKLAAKLLKNDGVLIVTIDECEMQRLGLLLQQEFPNAEHQVVTIVTSLPGSQRNTFTRVEEYALFCFFGASGVCDLGDNLLTHSSASAEEECVPAPKEVRWNSLLRSGNNGRPQDRPGLVYPVGFDKNGNVVGTGRSLAERRDAGEIAGDPVSLDSYQPDPNERIQGASQVVWPRSRAGALACWRLAASTLMGYVAERRVRTGRYKGAWTVSYLMDSQMEALAKGHLQLAPDDDGTGPMRLKPAVPRISPTTVWYRGRHGAGLHGTEMQKALLGEKRFDFPKSLYATADAVMSVVANRPDALIVDFFAGSGTTLHATALLNLADGGNRRCILVTNNEVSSDRSKGMNRKGLRPGDKEWEDEGVFHKVTRPRVEAALTGLTPSGKPVDEKLKYLPVPFGPQLDPDYEPKVHERKIAEGLPQSAVFAKLGFVDPDRLLWDGGGKMFNKVHLLLWAASGGHGPAPSVMVGDIDLGKHEPGWVLPGSDAPSGAPAVNGECRYGVLFRSSRVSGFCNALKDMPQVSHVWIDASDDDEFRHLSNVISIKRPDVKVSNLFRDLYDHFANKRRQIR